jgi:beta-lactam-binding protein with PASTA domain
VSSKDSTGRSYLRRLGAWPRSRIGAVAVAAVLLGGGLVVAVGAGHTVARAVLSDGSEHLTRGHEVVHVNGETGMHDAETARKLATGKQRLEVVRLSDGRLAVVNNDTREVTFVDPQTMEPTGPTITAPAGRGQLEVLPAGPNGYLVDRARNVVEPIGTQSKPVAVPEGIEGAVPSGDSVWLVTRSGEVLQISGDRRVRTIRLGGGLRITVADGHPVVATSDGTAYAVDGEVPTAVGDGLPTGQQAVLGSWRGADRYVVSVDRNSRRVVALDPRTRDRIEVGLPASNSGQPDLGAPVVLGNWIYVPDYAGPHLWQVDLAKRMTNQLKVPSKDPGPFELKVSEGKVWANSQYDQRALIVDGSGTHKNVDKGVSDATHDSERDGRGPSQPATPQPPTTGNQPSSSAQDTSGPANTAQPEMEKVVIPRFPRHTRYQAACDALQKLRLRCEPVPAGDANGLADGEVIGTRPGAGAKTPVGSNVQVRYVGPVKIPNVTGLANDMACKQITDLRLACDPRPSGNQAASPEQLGVVTAQSPAAGTDIAKGAQVSVTYADSIALPSFTNQLQGPACNQVTTVYKMKCEPVQGTPSAGQCTAAGTVYDQQPKQGAVARIGTSVQVMFCPGKVPVGDYVNPKPQNWQQACAAVERQGFQCNPVMGISPVGTGFQPGVAYDQNPKPGTQLDLKQPVTVAYYSDQGGTVPNVTNQDWNAACAAIQSAGYACSGNHELGSLDQNVVHRQDVGAGTVQKLGTPVNIYYSRWQKVQYFIYKHNSLPVWALRQEGNIPSGYGSQAFRVGAAYPPGTDITAPFAVNGFSCTIGGGRCNGYDTNHFYSHSSAPYPNFDGPNPAATFMTCNVPGTKQIYRVWKGPDSQRQYGVGDGTAGWEGSEPIGCVWP